ncbi:hypothetical protein [Aurantibacter sp.]|uniref:hypothetical protein n=1 Tax=Aurantibacter sp. TaxID=2807103 RepID=UPI0035C7DF78
MKFTILATVLLSLSLVGAQNLKNKEQKFVQYPENIDLDFTKKERVFLSEAFSQEYISVIDKDVNASRRFKHLLRNRVCFIYVPYEEKLKSYPKLSSIGFFTDFNKNPKKDLIFDRETFNVLKYNFTFFSKESYKVRIDNTNYVLVVESQFKK